MRSSISQASLFRNLPSSGIDILASICERITIERGDTLFSHGDVCDAMYIVADGKLDVLVSGPDGAEIVVSVLKVNDVVGEVQVLTGGLRTATVRASEQSGLIRINREALETLAMSNLDFSAELSGLILRRLQWNQLRDIIPTIIGDINDDQTSEVLSLAKWVNLKQGETLFLEGEPGDSFYILVTGLLGITVQDESESRAVGQVVKGEIIGEMSLLSNEPRAATVSALRNSFLVRFSNSDFNDMLRKYPELLLRITKVIIERLKKVNSRRGIVQASGRLSLVPISPNIPLAQLTKSLVLELESAGSVLSLNAESVDAQLGTPGIANSAPSGPGAIRLSSWLSTQEGDYDYIIFQADPTPTEWTRRCLQYSDQIIYVGMNGANPASSEIEQCFLGESSIVGDVPRRLVLLHPPGTERPTGTSNWLSCREVVMHHHIRLNQQPDIARLARFIIGKPFGLVLGGGGARGLAHIGVIKALVEAGIEVDAIGGTSMGALIGGEFALGRDSSTMKTISDKPFSTMKMILDFTVPLVSCTTGKIYSDYLLECFSEDLMIEDLWIPYFCVTSNLSRARMEVVRSGPLWSAVRTSTSLPGILPPMVYDGDAHVDGAIFNNVPADVMKDWCGGKVLAVDVGSSVDLVDNTPYARHLSGLRLMLSRLNPFSTSPKMPDIGSLLLRSAEVVSVANQKHIIDSSVDYYCKPPVEDYQILEWNAIDDLSRIGYEYTKTMINEWRLSHQFGKRRNSSD